MRRMMFAVAVALASAGCAAPQAHAGGFAERAAHAATDLRRDAQRVPVRPAVTGHRDDDGIYKKGTDST